MHCGVGTGIRCEARIWARGILGRSPIGLACSGEDASRLAGGSKQWLEWLLVVRLEGLLVVGDGYRILRLPLGQECDSWDRKKGD